MSSLKEHVARHRRSLRAATLLGVLLLCVAIAWLLVDYKSADAIEGAAILAEIQRKGLSQYLPDSGSEDYYLITTGGQPIGWKFVYTKLEENGGYGGGCIMLQNTGPDSVEISASRWQLNKNASAGKYISHVFLKDALPKEIYTTEITLGDKDVQLQQSLGGKGINAASQRPANYIPEDVTRIAMFQLAQKKRNACFRTIYDGILSENSAIPFITLKCRYSGMEGGLLKLAVRSGIDNSSTEDSVLFFNAAGKIVKVLSSDGVVESLSDMKTLKKTFPNSMNVIKTIVSQ